MLSEQVQEKIVNFLTKQGIAILISIAFLAFVAWQNVNYSKERDKDVSDLKELVKQQQITIQNCSEASSKLSVAIKEVGDNMRALTIELNDLKREIRYKK